MNAPDSFPRRYARTQRFSLGAPRNISVSADGQRLVFLRSEAGDDPINMLWVHDIGAAAEPRVVADPKTLGADDSSLPAAERARRERLRESGGGIVAFSTDRTTSTAVFALAGRLWHTDLSTDVTRELEVTGPVFGPHLDRSGRFVAYVSGRELRCFDLESNTDSLVVGPGPDDSSTVSWASAEFVAAEEMSRTRGFWWAPDSESLIAARVDTTAVAEWHIADPNHPERTPTAVRYPAAGTTNASVELHLVSRDGSQPPVVVDTGDFEYIAKVSWGSSSPPLVTVQSRDQRTLTVLEVDTATGSTSTRYRQDDEHWVELIAGSPTLASGRLFTIEDRGEDRCLVMDGEVLSPPGLQVRSLVSANDERVLVTGSREPTELHVLRIGLDGSTEALTDGPGVHRAVVGGATTVITRASLAHDGNTVEVRPASGPEFSVESNAADLGIDINVSMMELGETKLRGALLLPSGDHHPHKLPVLLDPYGGPHAQRVLATRGAMAASQWLADQGFAVLVVDGRGTPGRGPAFERSVRGDLAAPVLDDQIEALHAAAATESRMDLGRVAIRGWSFGGYLAALAVLRRPDVFHAAVAGAPVTDWRFYDTHYTERYLGHPDTEPENYERTSLINDAAALTRPLLLIHGLADDNVLAVHTLRLSQALLNAGRPHQVLPLSGVTHMTPQEEVAENLLLLQVDFLQTALAGTTGADDRS